MLAFLSALADWWGCGQGLSCIECSRLRLAMQETSGYELDAVDGERRWQELLLYVILSRVCFLSFSAHVLSIQSIQKQKVSGTERHHTHTHTTFYLKSVLNGTDVATSKRC